MNSEEVDITEATYWEVFFIAPYGINRGVNVKMNIRQGQKMEDLLDHAAERLKAWHKKYETSLEQRSFPVEVRDVSETRAAKTDFTSEEFDALKRTVEECTNKDMALKLISNSNFRYNVELKNIANSK